MKSNSVAGFDVEAILADLRKATTPSQFDEATDRLVEARLAIEEQQAASESAEEAAIFSGENPEQSRNLARVCADRLRTIEIALRGAEPRRAAAARRELGEEMATLGAEIGEKTTELRETYGRLRESLLAARKELFASVNLARAIEARSLTVQQNGRPDLAVNPSTVRRQAMDIDLPKVAEDLGRIPIGLRDADRVLALLATGRRYWQGRDRVAGVISPRDGRETFVTAVQEGKP